MIVAAVVWMATFNFLLMIPGINKIVMSYHCKRVTKRDDMHMYIDPEEYGTSEGKRVCEK